MHLESDKRLAIEHAATTIDLIAGLERALDSAYRRMVTSAATQWEQAFGAHDPSDACVKVRIKDAPARHLPSAGFIIPSGKSALGKGRKLPLPRFASLRGPTRRTA